MAANRDFCDRRASTESVRYRRGKAPTGAMTKRYGMRAAARARHSTKAALISGIHFPVKPSWA